MRCSLSGNLHSSVFLVAREQCLADPASDKAAITKEVSAHHAHFKILQLAIYANCDMEQRVAILGSGKCIMKAEML